jgi:type III pantothenate kinase
VLAPQWLAMSERYLGHEMLNVGPGLKTGMALRYDNPREIGADRLANAVAIRERFGGPAICVDFGTSVNFDIVGPGGDFLGGILVPGVEISLAALTARGARLPNIDLEPPRTVIGKSTVDAIRSGVIYGFAGAIDGILRRLLDELGEETDVIATGGLASAIVPYTERIDEVDDLLTLTGLRLLYERNS